MLSQHITRGLRRLCSLPNRKTCPHTVSHACISPTRTPLDASSPQIHHVRRTYCSKPGPSPLRAAEAAIEPSTEQGSIYDNPQMYDDAFSYRDFTQECSFLQQLYQHHKGEPVKSILELGCGPGRHATLLAQQGISVTAVDLNPTMLSFAQQQSQGTPNLTFTQGDMTSLDLPSLQQQPADMVMILLGTFSHLLDNDAALACLRHAAKHLKPGGLLVLELAHPGDLFDGSLIVNSAGGEMWEVERSGRKLLVEWGSELDDFDPVTQVLNRTVTINVFQGEDLVEALEEVHPYRQYTAQELDLLARVTGYSVAGLYGEMDLGIGVAHEDAYRLIAVLEKL